MPDISIASQIAFALAGMEAQALESMYLDTEHLFLGLCKIEDILIQDGVAIPGLGEEQLEGARQEARSFRDFLGEQEIDPKRARRRLRKILYESQEERGEFSGHRTQRCRDAFEIAARFCRHEAEGSLALRHFLAAVLIQESPAIDRLLSELSVDKADIERALGCGDMGELEPSIGRPSGEPAKKEGAEPHRPAEGKTPFLDQFGRDVTRLAAEGKLDPTIGRKEEMRKVAQVLAQKKKNNPILVGDAGVGKTCIVEGLAQRIVEPEAPEVISDFRIIELSMGSLVAGAMYRGQFEERLNTMVRESSSDPNIIIFIDEIHTMMGAGKAGGEALDAANILKPALARGDIKCIGATTTAEYRKYIEKDSALERRFQLVWVDEPSREETILILGGLRPRFEQHFTLTIPDRVLERAVELSMRYLTDFRLPDKAIDIVDQACARKILGSLTPRRSDGEGAVEEITVEDVAKVVSDRCRIPVESLTVEESERLLKIEEHLGARVIGQDQAIKDVAETIRSAKAGLKDPRKPVGTFLFLGATGTGKTELGKALAEFLFFDKERLITFDMTEYQEKHTVSKLIGSPPGYVGYEEEGQLTGKVRTYPYSVVLFDEIEKAHPDIFNLFLQIFDEGRLTDAHGRKANFSEAVIIMTSNLGASVSLLKKPMGVDISERQGAAAGEIPAREGAGVSLEEEEAPESAGAKWKDYEGQIRRSIRRALRPELLNRIQKEIVFYPLSRATVKRVVEKIEREFNERLSSRETRIELSDEAVEFMLERGYSEEYGAREMQRTFEQYVSEPLSQMILKGGVGPGHVVRVLANSSGLRFETD